MGGPESKASAFEAGVDDGAILGRAAHHRRPQTRTAYLPGEETARNIVGGVLAAVRAEPACDRIDIDPEPAQDLLRHRPSLRR